MVEEKSLSLFRKYFFETSIFVLAVSLGFTVNFVLGLNEKLFKYISEDRQQAIEVIKDSKKTIDNNTEVFKELKEILNKKK